MLDQRTLLFVLALLPGLMAIVALSLRVGLGEKARGLGLWALALSFTAAPAALLVGGQGQGTVGVLVQNAFWVPSMVLSAVAARRFFGLFEPNRIAAAVGLAVYAVVALATVREEWATLRIIVLAALHVVCMAVAVHALRSAHPRLAGLGPLLMGLGFVLIALVQSWRGATALLDGADAARFLVGGLVMGVLLVSAMVAQVCITVAYLLLSTERVRGELEALASRDTLSGVLNRRGFHELATPLLALARRRAEPVALAVIDLDDFKAVNDLGGHALGDAVIARLGRVLATECRAEDLVARFGGEEFVVLMPMTDAEGAHRLMERLRLAIASQRLGEAPTVVGVTASIGLAVAGGAAEFEALYRRADDALYRAKAGGKDQVVQA